MAEAKLKIIAEDFASETVNRISEITDKYAQRLERLGGAFEMSTSKAQGFFNVLKNLDDRQWVNAGGDHAREAKMQAIPAAGGTAALGATAALSVFGALRDLAKEPLPLSLDPERFLHDLQAAWDVFRDIRTRIETPLALTVDVSQALAAIHSVKSALDAIPAVTKKTVVIEQLTYNSAINITSADGRSGADLAQEVQAIIADDILYDRSPVVSALSGALGA